MEGVNHCDYRGIQVLEGIWHRCRERGGSIFFIKVGRPVLEFMKTNGFYERLGGDHFLTEEESITHLFHHVLDPAVCIYECRVRMFAECQNLPRPTFAPELSTSATPKGIVSTISPWELREKLHATDPPMVVDVREPREFKRGHIPQAQSLPLSRLSVANLKSFNDRDVVLVCRSEKRSRQAAAFLTQHSSDHTPKILQGGMLAWESIGGPHHSQPFFSLEINQHKNGHH
jgi:SulP family sulfate permease